MGKKTLTIEIIKERVYKKSPTIRILDDVYVSRSKKLTCECTICGFIWETSENSLSNGHKCSNCYGNTKKTLEQIKDIIFEKNPNIQILSTEYLGTHGELICKCLLDGCEFKSSFRRLDSGVGCPRCKGIERLTIDSVKEKIFELHPNILVLSKEYYGVDKKITCKCLSCGHEWDTTFSRLKKLQGCSNCRVETRGDKTRLNLDDIKIRLRELNPSIKILSTKYKNNASPLECECLIDGNVWNSNWNRLKVSGCPVCALKLRSGEHNTNWKGGRTPLNNHLRMSIGQWKRDSSKNCGYKSVITGKDFEHIHHLTNFSKIVDEALLIERLPIYQNIGEYNEGDLLNLEKTVLDLNYKYGLGVCMTKDEHLEFHSIYGKKNNTPQQFQEFLRMKKAS